MSVIYDEYLQDHRNNVHKAFEWLKKYYFPNHTFDNDFINELEHMTQFDHDTSKNDAEEYAVYDEHFYGNRSYENEQAFLYAWNHHLHHNPHHWQYWILVNDDKNNGVKLLEIPDKYLFEMICDWWSFSWKNGNLYEIFEWYNNGKEYRLIHHASLEKIEFILAEIKDLLDREKVGE